jgi:hypothetical protein
MAKEMVAEKSVVINRSKADVFNYLKITQNQEHFSVWNMSDPNKQTTFTGTDGTVGFVYTWDSKLRQTGAGKQTITNIVDDERIEYIVQFERPMKNTGRSKFVLTAENDNTTNVQWSFSCPTKFPMSLFSGAFAKMLGKDIDKSLHNLKQLLEG